MLFKSRYMKKLKSPMLFKAIKHEVSFFHYVRNFFVLLGFSLTKSTSPPLTTDIILKKEYYQVFCFVNYFDWLIWFRSADTRAKVGGRFLQFNPRDKIQFSVNTLTGSVLRNIISVLFVLQILRQRHRFWVTFRWKEILSVQSHHLIF